MVQVARLHSDLMPRPQGVPVATAPMLVRHLESIAAARVGLDLAVTSMPKGHRGCTDLLSLRATGAVVTAARRMLAVGVFRPRVLLAGLVGITAAAGREAEITPAKRKLAGALELQVLSSFGSSRDGLRTGAG